MTTVKGGATALLWNRDYVFMSFLLQLQAALGLAADEPITLAPPQAGQRRALSDLARQLRGRPVPASQGRRARRLSTFTLTPKPLKMIQ